MAVTATAQQEPGAMLETAAYMAEVEAAAEQAKPLLVMVEMELKA